MFCKIGKSDNLKDPRNQILKSYNYLTDNTYDVFREYYEYDYLNNLKLL